ncbi:TatD family hydrolase [Pirellulaceae bacterium SH501]
MGWFDTHAHLAEPSLRSQLADVLGRAQSSGLEGILCVAVDGETSRECLEIAQSHSMVRSSVGIHPNYAHQAKSGDWDLIASLANEPRVVALGETGLDKHWDDCPFPLQQSNFAAHWQLSRATGLPVIIHMRDCEEEMLAALESEYVHGRLNGVMHSFAGSLATAMKCLEMGLFVSFAGMLTYKKSVELREVAKQIPIERLLLETDCPYLSPEPNRSKRPNEPSWMVHTAKVLADVKSMEVVELRSITAENTKRLFARW